MGEMSGAQAICARVLLGRIIQEVPGIPKKYMRGNVFEGVEKIGTGSEHCQLLSTFETFRSWTANNSNFQNFPGTFCNHGQRSGFPWEFHAEHGRCPNGL